jgi:hypothetical protein
MARTGGADVDYIRPAVKGAGGGSSDGLVGDSTSPAVGDVSPDRAEPSEYHSVEFPTFNGESPSTDAGAVPAG